MAILASRNSSLLSNFVGSCIAVKRPSIPPSVMNLALNVHHDLCEKATPVQAASVIFADRAAAVPALIAHCHRWRNLRPPGQPHSYFGDRWDRVDVCVGCGERTIKRPVVAYGNRVEPNSGMRVRVRGAGKATSEATLRNCPASGTVLP